MSWLRFCSCLCVSGVFVCGGGVVVCLVVGISNAVVHMDMLHIDMLHSTQTHDPMCSSVPLLCTPHRLPHTPIPAAPNKQQTHTLTHHRSVEGRRRIIHEVVHLLASDATPRIPPAPITPETAAAVPFRAAPGIPAPQVKALVELVSQLLSGSARSMQRSGAGGSAQLSSELTRAMREAGMVHALLAAFRRLDIDHPKVVVGTMLSVYCCRYHVYSE